METMAISEFKAKCPAVVERVRRTKMKVTITRHGHPVAEVVPVQPPAVRQLGGMRGTIKILGDIVGPITDPNDWTLDKEDGIW